MCRRSEGRLRPRHIWRKAGSELFEMEEAMMKLVSVTVLLAAWALPALGATANYHDVPLLDVGCSKKAAADPDAHTKDCALMCVV